MKPLAAIVRSSDRVTERQKAGTYHGDEDQVADINRYAASLRGGPVPVVFLDPELDVSGGKPIEARASLREAIEGVEAGRFSGIVAANLKRLTRSRSGLQIWERVEAVGGRVHCAAENLDTTTPNGRFVRDIHLAEAVREREEHAERHAKRRQKTVEAGMWRVRIVPRGYAFAGPAVDGRYRGLARRLVPAGPDADDVRSAFAAAASGVPVTTIASRLGMTPTGARRLIQNRVYLGELWDGEHVNLAAHEPLVDEDLWLAAQAVPTVRAARSQAPPALLAGLVRCAGCGHVMSRSTKKVVVYSCHGQHSAGQCTAKAGITLRLLDEHVTAIALRELARLRVTETEDRDALDRARAALRAAERELAAYLQAVSAADIGADAFRVGAQQRQAEVDQRRDALGALSRRRLARLDGDPVKIWQLLAPDHRNQLLRSLIECVLVERSGGRGRIRPIAERVRVIRHGAGLIPACVDRVLPVRPIPLPDADDPVTLGM